MSFDLDERDLLTACMRDVRRAWDSEAAPPPNPRTKAVALTWLAEAEDLLPLSQTEAVVKPLRAWVDAKSTEAFANPAPEDEDAFEVFFDLMRAIHAPPRRFALPTAAFQEVVSDLYDGFLSAEDRRGVVAPARVTLPPLVCWADPKWGIYTWPSESLADLGVAGAVVCLSPAFARGGLAGWASLGHETCGHDVLSAYAGLQPELRRAVSRGLEGAGVGDRLIEHWMYGFEEAAADVLGVLNLGPTAALADVAFFRGCAPADDPRMGMKEDPEDEHPVDILRVMLEASVVRALRFASAEDWAARIEREIRRDARGKDPQIGGRPVPLLEARTSAAVFARTMVGTRLESLSGVSLGEIQNWHDHDQELAEGLCARLQQRADRAIRVGPRTYAAHVLAGALMAMFENATAPARSPELVRVFERTIATLAAEHDENAAWQPRAAHRHRGDAGRHVFRGR
jgi:hypothetical protein